MAEGFPYSFPILWELKVSLYTFRIDGQDCGGYLDLPSIQVSEGLEVRGDTCSFEVTIPIWEIPNTIRPPVPGNEVIFEVLGSTEFKGIIGEVVQMRGPNPDAISFACSCTDFTRWLDRKLVVMGRPEELAGVRIRAMVQWIKDNLGIFPFGTSQVGDGFTVSEEEYDYETLSSIIDALAESCQFQWYVDFEKEIHFFAQVLYVSPLNTAYGNVLDLDSNLEIGDLGLTEDVTQVKNRIYVRGFQQKGSSEYHDGPYYATENQSFYKLYQEPWDVESTRILVNDVERTLRLDPLDGASETMVGAPDEAFVCLFNMGIRFPTCDLPAGGDKIDAYYHAALPDRLLMHEDPYSIAFMAKREANEDPSPGVHEFVVSVPTLRVESSEPIDAMGEYMLRRFAWPYRAGTFLTYTLTGWRPGQYFSLRSIKRDIYDYETYAKTGRKRDVRMFIHKVTKTYQTIRDKITGEPTVLILSEVEFANQPYSL